MHPPGPSVSGRRSPRGHATAGAARAARTGRALELTILAAVAVLALARCDRGQAELSAEQAAMLASGDPERGRGAIGRYGCGSCHRIAGVAGAASMIGPPLDAIGARAYLAGVLVNTPENLVRWIRDPQGVDSMTAMPDMGVTEQDARDIAAYLYSLR